MSFSLFLKYHQNHSSLRFIFVNILHKDTYTVDRNRTCAYGCYDTLILKDGIGSQDGYCLAGLWFPYTSAAHPES
jgi:hypothetical protein